MTSSYPAFVRRDLDAFFGLAINNLVDLIIIVSVGRGLLHLPDALVFGRILPGAALSLLVGNLYFAHQAAQLARREGRSDVTAQPFGLNTPTVFVFLYGIMYPVYTRTQDPALTWRVGVAACFLSGIIEGLGAFVGDWVQRVVPRAALLATLAGAAITFIGLNPIFDLFAAPVVGFLPLAVILLGYFANYRFPGKMPAGLLAVVLGSTLAWTATDTMSASRLGASLANVGWYPPLVSFAAVLDGLGEVLPFLSAVAPLAVMNFMGSLQCVESAAAAGDRYRPFPTMAVNGAATILGALLGSCFPTTVYIGHPAWKALGARRGYSILNGVVFTVICLTGLMGLVLALVPTESASAILLFVGLVITAQAFEASPARYYPAIALGLVPNIAAWARVLVGQVTTAAGTSADKISAASWRNGGLNYAGLETLAAGSLLTAMLLAMIAIHLIDGRFRHAAASALAASALSFVGLMHADRVGLAVATLPAAGYLMMAALFFALSFGRRTEPASQ